MCACSASQTFTGKTSVPTSHIVNTSFMLEVLHLTTRSAQEVGVEQNFADASRLSVCVQK